MKWLVDAQLPRRLADFLNHRGHDAVHTLDLRKGNRASDAEIGQAASEESRVLISKDRDFLDSYLILGVPRHLLWVTTGNISNEELLSLFDAHLTDLVVAFSKSDCAELTNAGVVLQR